MSTPGLRGWWERYRDEKRRQRERDELLAELVEHMVQASDPAIRKVAGYRERLKPPVAGALGYIEALIELIPGPVRLSAEAWDKDALVHALFVHPDELCALIAHSDELAEFFRKSRAGSAIALLSATRRERTVYGTEVQGEIVRRDVPQTAVEFYHHKLVSPAATADEIHRELICRGLSVLASHALAKILKLHAIREELSEERRMLAIKMKIRNSRQGGLEGLLVGGGGDAPDDDGAARQLLEEIDRQLLDLEPVSATPRDFLRKLTNVLHDPGATLTGKRIDMRLDWRGVKQENTSAAGDAPIALAELEVPGQIRRVTVLAEIAADACRRL